MIAFSSQQNWDQPIHDEESHLDQNVLEWGNASLNDIENSSPSEAIRRSFATDHTSSLAWRTISQDGFTM